MKPYPLVDDLLRLLLRHYRTLLWPGGNSRLDTRSAVDHVACGGQPGLPETLPSATRETKNCSRASANSSGWSLKGVRYVFSLVTAITIAAVWGSKYLFTP